jgi:hypothetical protein
MSDPELPATADSKPKVEDFLTPASFIRAALAVDKSFKYAILAAGVLAILVVFAKFGVAFATLVFGGIAFIGIMILYLLFAQASKLSKSALDKPAKVFVWAILIIALVIILLLVSSAFFNWPLPIQKSIIEQLTKRTTSGVNPPVAPPADSGNSGTVQKAIILTELIDAYKATAQQLGVFDNWGQSSMRQTLRVNQTMLTGTTKGHDVSMSIDPLQLPVPQYYDANSSQIATLGSSQASLVVSFFSAYERYRKSLVALTSNPSDFNGAFITANVQAREAVVRGRAAICALGGIPPRIFHEEPGGFAEPVPPNCSESPFGN